MTSSRYIGSYLSLDAVRDRVVALCGDVAGARVLDVGCGDGLTGRALLPAVGPGGSVTFLDHDVDVTASLAAELEGAPAACVVTADARTLAGVPDASIDLVVMRAVLLYIPEKREALAAARRVLAPGGRLVVSEPVNRSLYDDPGRLWGYDLRDLPDIAETIRRGYMEDASPEVRAMTDWSERDLLAMVLDAGFGDVRMEVVTEVPVGRPLPWLAFLHARWTPWLPTVAQVTRARLTDDERARFEATLRSRVETGHQQVRMCNLFLTATRWSAALSDETPEV